MWNLKALLPGEEVPLVYIGPDRSIQIVFELLKREFPRAVFLLESISGGTVHFPHQGDGYPFWYRSEGLENMQEYVRAKQAKEDYWREYERKKAFEDEGIL